MVSPYRYLDRSKKKPKYIDVNSKWEKNDAFRAGELQYKTKVLADGSTESFTSK